MSDEREATGRNRRPWRGRLAVPVVAGLLVAAAPAIEAQEPYVYTASLLAGIGGSVDQDEAGYGNTAFQLGLSLVGDGRVHVGARLGHFETDDADTIGLLAAPSLDYLLVAGEYRYPDVFYESGLFLGLGAYRLEGTVAGRPVEETTAGMAVGASGDFEMTRRTSFVGEIALHYVLSDFAEVFVTALVGVALHF